jgi:hypothetical protein
LRNKFWRLSLHELTHEEWEALCDGCGKCCLLKLEDGETAEIYYTDVACELLDQSTCRCSDYNRRLQKVPDCLNLREGSNQLYSWLPLTCAYRLRWQNQALPEWHPLLSGQAESVHASGHSVKNKTVRLAEIKDLRDRVTQWDDPSAILSRKKNEQ